MSVTVGETDNTSIVYDTKENVYETSVITDDENNDDGEDGHFENITSDYIYVQFSIKY